MVNYPTSLQGNWDDPIASSQRREDEIHLCFRALFQASRSAIDGLDVGAPQRAGGPFRAVSKGI